jgi:hypothetical protein
MQLSLEPRMTLCHMSAQVEIENAMPSDLLALLICDFDS